jgi:hypothetical protein
MVRSSKNKINQLEDYEILTIVENIGAGHITTCRRAGNVPLGTALYHVTGVTLIRSQYISI